MSPRSAGPIANMETILNLKDEMLNMESKGNPETILNLLSTKTPPSTPKKLTCAPSLSSPVIERVKETSLEFAYSSVCISSSEDLVIPDEVLARRFYAFKAVLEHQAAAWKSFSRNCRSAEFALVSCVNTVFFFNDGHAKATGLTGTAHRRLAELSAELPNIEPEKAIAFINGWIASERTFLYSSQSFDYAVITPLTSKSAELQSAVGAIHRITLCGCLFGPTVNALKERNPGATVSTSVLKF
jgi:hypothetical protein